MGLARAKREKRERGAGALIPLLVCTYSTIYLRADCRGRGSGFDSTTYRLPVTKKGSVQWSMCQRGLSL